MKNQLTRLERLERKAAFSHRLFTDPPPVLEIAYVDADTGEVVPELSYSVQPVSALRVATLPSKSKGAERG